MVWDDTFSQPAEGRDEPIELVGTYLRLTGVINLGRFGRLSDLINASSGYIRVRNAQLLRRNGEATKLVLPELMVDQDEISFIAQTDAHIPEPGSGVGFIEPTFGDDIEARKARQFVMFTPGHVVSGQVHVFGATDAAAFVDSSDPRFVAATGVTTRSLADSRIVTHYPFILINRTQMIAASEVVTEGDVPPGDVPDL